MTLNGGPVRPALTQLQRRAEPVLLALPRPDTSREASLCTSGCSLLAEGERAPVYSAIDNR